MTASSSAKRRFARIDRLPPSVFNITAELKLAARRRGDDIIDMSMGNPDGATPAHIVAKLTEVAQRPDTHGYSASKGIPRLRRAISHWYGERYGVEINPDSVLAAIRRGVPVLDRRVEDALVDIADDAYDTVVLSRTLQSMLAPEFVLAQMARVAERLIVSVPNFGYYPNRLRLLRGRMPVSKEIPYAWYDTPNLRFTTLADLEDLFSRLDLIVDRRFTYTQTGRRLRMYGSAANLLAGAAVYVLRPTR